MRMMLKGMVHLKNRKGKEFPRGTKKRERKKMQFDEKKGAKSLFVLGLFSDGDDVF